MLSNIFRKQQFPFHGSWRENLYPDPRIGTTKEDLQRKETKDKKKIVHSASNNHNYENGKQKLRNIASDRAYKAYGQVTGQLANKY